MLQVVEILYHKSQTRTYGSKSSYSTIENMTVELTMINDMIISLTPKRDMTVV